MEAFPPQYVEHNLPLVLVTGLGSDDGPNSGPTLSNSQGVRIRIDSPECRSEQATRVLQELKSLDGTGRAWNSRSLPGPTGSIRYKMKTIGRTYNFPARKMAPLPQSPGEATTALRPSELHSPLSPLSAGSHLFPDGLFTPLWFSKHQEQVPALLLAFFSIRANEASQDEKLKSDINVTRSALKVSGFNTRLVVVLISDQSILHAPDLEDRLGSIRRATNLDPKSGLFFMPPISSQAEVGTFIQEIMTALQPSCIEYYRDLSKHARRKKARGPTSPQNTLGGGASHSTSTSGWNVRYEIKLGVFAEFRQELDVAERHYASALEELFSTEGGVLETTASWSPRFDEARLISDSIALRILRAQLWTGQTTGAVQSWQNYKFRMKDLIDRRGKGSSTYGWDAFEARWASVMSQLVQLADIPALNIEAQANNVPSSLVFVQPEGAAATGERISPWNMLHHSGYWLRLVLKGIRSRYEKALAIPEEDRLPPGQSPASTVASRWKNYDTYLAPDPHEEASDIGIYDHVAEMQKVCTQAMKEFEARQQLRMREQLDFELAEDLVSAGRWGSATQVLLQLWDKSVWREDGWTTPFARLLRLLHEGITRRMDVNDAHIVPVLIWEMLKVPPASTTSGMLDITKCLDSWNIGSPLTLEIHGADRLCPLTASFAFRDFESHVGESQYCQIGLHYDAPKESRPLYISQLQVRFGDAKTLTIEHVEQGEERTLDLGHAEEAEGGNFQLTTDLRLLPQAETFVQVALRFREAGLWRVTGTTLLVQTDQFSLAHHCGEDWFRPYNRWYVRNGHHEDGMLLPHDTSSINILPKPPKVDIILQSLRQCYWTDEHVRLKINLVNDEMEEISGTLEASVTGASTQTLAVKWADKGDGPNRKVTNLASLATDQALLLIRAPSEASKFTLSLDLRYSLASDSGIPMEKTLTVELPFIPALETSFTFAPRWHASQWPSYFDSQEDGTSDSPKGVTQLWQLGAQIASLADDTIRIHSLELQVDDVHGDTACQVLEPLLKNELMLQPDESTVATFNLTTRKWTIDDRRPTYVDVSLFATWSLGDAAEKSMTRLPVPRLTIPTSEPRVLCTIEPDLNGRNVLQYHLENPSTHFLTFALTMDPSEDFCFSGLKYRTMSLAPLSRRSISYNLLLHEDAETVGIDARGCWIKPELRVVDSYYQKNLRVHPGGSRVKLDEAKEINVWAGTSKPSG